MPITRPQQRPLISEEEALGRLEQIHIVGLSDDDSGDDDDNSIADEETRLHSTRNDRDSQDHDHPNVSNDRYPSGIMPMIPAASFSSSSSSAVAPSPSPHYTSINQPISSFRSSMLSFYDKISPLIRAAPGYHLLQDRRSTRGGTTSEPEQPPRPSTSSISGSVTPCPIPSVAGTQPFSASPSSSTSSAPTASSSLSSSDPEAGPSAPRPIQPRRIGNYGYQAHDGVFANLSAKPEVEGPKPSNADQVLPSYESAIQDVTPPYYQMTAVAPGIFGDEILVDGMPVGNIFQFLWNVIVSSSFQFVGVLLTFLLHNTHASKSGSLVGLGMTLLNFGYHIGREESGEYEDSDTGYMESPSNGHGGDETAEGSWFPFLGDSDGSGEEHWVSLLLMLLGWMVVVKALADYARAKRTEMVIQAQPEGERLESQADYEMAMFR